MSLKHAYEYTVATLIVRKIFRRNNGDAPLMVSVVSTAPAKLSQKCFYCRSPGKIVRRCLKKKADSERQDNEDRRRCFKCVVVGHIAKGCPKENNKDKNKSKPLNMAMIRTASTASSIDGGRKPNIKEVDVALVLFEAQVITSLTLQTLHRLRDFSR